MLVELARIGRTQKSLIEYRNVGDPAHRPFKTESLAFAKFPLPAALHLIGKDVEPARNVACCFGRVARIAENVRTEHAGNGGLLDHLPVVATVQAVEQVANDARLLDQRSEILAGAVLARMQPQHRVLQAAANEVVLERALVLEVLLRFSARDLVERWLRNEEVTAIYQLAHLTVEESEQQGADMRAVHVGVGHDDDFVIAHLLGVELVADTGSQRGDQRADLLAGEHLVGPRTLDIENLAAQRKHRLEGAVTSLFGRAAGAVALDNEQLGFGGVTLLAVGELAGKRSNPERALARHLARLARSFARRCRLNDLGDYELGLGRMLLEPVLQRLVDEVLDHRTNLR